MSRSERCQHCHTVITAISSDGAHNMTLNNTTWHPYLNTLSHRLWGNSFSGNIFYRSKNMSDCCQKIIWDMCVTVQGPWGSRLREQKTACSGSRDRILFNTGTDSVQLQFITHTTTTEQQFVAKCFSQWCVESQQTGNSLTHNKAFVLLDQNSLSCIVMPRSQSAIKTISCFHFHSQ